MITDKLLRLSLDAGDSLSNKTTGTYYSDAHIDLGSLLRDVAEGQDLYMVFSIPTTILSTGGAGSIDFQAFLNTDAAANPGNQVQIGATGPLATNTAAGTTSLVGGLIIPIRLNMTTIANTLTTTHGGSGPWVGVNAPIRRYLSARYVVATNPTATNAAQVVITDIVTDIQSLRRYYPSGFTVI
jgi:hypothetical protein